MKREWVLVSPHRTQRPWQGQTETKAAPVALQLVLEEREMEILLKR